MSVGEIKQEASRLEAADVIHLAAWFHHLTRRKDPAYRKSLDDAFDAIDGGDRMSLRDYRHLVGELEKSGM